MNELDTRDRKLLELLARDARAPLTRLAKKLRLSKNAVSYRMDRLKSKGIVRNFIALLDYEKLDVMTLDCFIRLKGDPSALLNCLVKHHNTLHVMTLFGQWDIQAQFVTRDFFHFHRLFYDILQKYADVIDTYRTNIAVRQIKHGSAKRSLRTKYQDVKLSAVDLRILLILSNDARITYKSLGDSVGESLETVRNRVRRLVSSGIIKGFSTLLDYKAMGFVEYVCKVQLHHFSMIDERSLAGFLDMKPSVKLALMNGDSPEMYLIISDKDALSIESVLKELNMRFHSHISRMDYMPVKQTLKVDYFPAGLASDGK